MFEDEFGYYLTRYPPACPRSPEGWQERLIPLDFGDVKAFFVQPDDVAVSKYMRGEERDLRRLLAGLGSSTCTPLNVGLRAHRHWKGELPAARKGWRGIARH